MGRKVITSEQYHVPGVKGFTQAVAIPARGTLVFVSGVTARTADGTIVALGDVAGQARQCYENISGILSRAGGSLADVVRMVTYLRDIEEIWGVLEVRTEFFGDQLPASTSVEVSRLFDERQLIEVEVTALIAPESLPDA